MIDHAAAIALYRTHCSKVGIRCVEPHRSVCDRHEYWYFVDQEPAIGRRGVIIRKKDGMLTVVGSDLGLDREVAFWAYERGLLTGNCNLIITDCGADLEVVLDVLIRVSTELRGLKLREPEREYWRQRLTTLPALIFANANLHAYVRALWEAEQN